jgi:hypothetical protein
MINTFTGIFTISIAWLGLMLWDEVRNRAKKRKRRP